MSQITPSNKPDLTILNKWDTYRGKQFSIVFPSSSDYDLDPTHQFPAIAPFTISHLQKLRQQHGANSKFLKPIASVLPKRLLSYNELRRHTVTQDDAIHFYLDDNKFDAIYSYPARAIEKIFSSGAGWVIGPDWSMFREWPRPVQMYNYYRNNWMTVLWQKVFANTHIKVIPNCCWPPLTTDLPYWNFPGIPPSSIVTISTVGSAKNPQNQKRFLEGFTQLLQALHPQYILCYGSEIPGMYAIAQRQATTHHAPTILKFYETKWNRYKKEGRN